MKTLCLLPLLAILVLPVQNPPTPPDGSQIAVLFQMVPEPSGSWCVGFGQAGSVTCRNYRRQKSGTQRAR